MPGEWVLPYIRGWGSFLSSDQVIDSCAIALELILNLIQHSQRFALAVQAKVQTLAVLYDSTVMIFFFRFFLAVQLYYRPGKTTSETFRFQV